MHLSMVDQPQGTASRDLAARPCSLRDLDVQRFMEAAWLCKTAWKCMQIVTLHEGSCLQPQVLRSCRITLCLYEMQYESRNVCTHSSYIPHDCSFTECHSFGVTKCPLQLPSHKRKQFQKKNIYLFWEFFCMARHFIKKSAIMYGW